MRRLGAVLTVMLACWALTAVHAAADDLEIPITIEKNRFQPSDIKVKAGTDRKSVV